jgi:hypothetical protein
MPPSAPACISRTRSAAAGVWDKEHIEEVGGEAMLQSLAMQDESRLALEDKVAGWNPRTAA